MIAVAAIDRELNQPMVDNLDLFLRRCEPGERRSLVMCINSPGGATMLGEQMYDRLRKAVSEGRVRLTTFNTGRTDSAAVSVFCAGGDRIAALESAFLLHEAGFVHFKDDAEDDRAKREAWAKATGTGSLARVLAKAVGHDIDHWRVILEQEKTWTAAEAMDMGLVTRIGVAPFGGGVENIDLNRASREWSKEESDWLLEALANRKA